jgi:hypothetical protein
MVSAEEMIGVIDEIFFFDLWSISYREYHELLLAVGSGLEMCYEKMWYIGRVKKPFDREAFVAVVEIRDMILLRGLRVLFEVCRVNSWYEMIRMQPRPLILEGEILHAGVA